MHLKFATKSSGLPVVTRSDLDLLGMEVLNNYMPEVLKCPNSVDIDKLIEDGIILNIEKAHLWPKNLLGFVTFADVTVPIANEDTLSLEEGTIVVEKDLNDTKYRFTAAHELAHWILHRAYYCKDHRIYEFRNTECSYIACKNDVTELGKKNPKLAHTDDEIAEWQADSLAAALIMPKNTFISVAENILSDHGFTDKKLISGKNVTEGKKVVKEIADFFQVSDRSARIRMRGFNLYEGDCPHNLAV